MSRVGRIPIKLPRNININYDGIVFSVKGDFGMLTIKIPNIFNLRLKDNILYLDLKKHKLSKSCALHGLYRTLISNMIIGVSNQFKLILKLKGVGYKAFIEENTIILNVGYSHTIKKLIPNEIFVEVLQNTNIIMKSCNKEKLGIFASQIRSCRKPEPYKGKGILYENEIIKYKKGKISKK